ncbi:MAG TPA: sulfite exporter TauE/SafE family protein [Streptosporangiaceae bacterium]|nr:sulfite exporter TauE/SafE family protein [Streptosporangiaceae bacterium]
MTPADLVLLVVAGIAAGIVSTVAALASLVSYPVLLALGLPPLAANVTNTVSLSFTAVGAAAGSRPELAGQGARLRRLGLVTALGGAAGAAILLLTPARTFEAAAPVLIGGASLVLLLQPAPPAGPAGTPAAPDASGAPDAAGAVDGPRAADGPGAPPAAGADGPGAPQAAGPPARPGAAGRAARRRPWRVSRPRPGNPDREQSRARLAMLFCVAIYVGYFGAAGGILMLAVLIPMLSQPLARTNAVKNVINGLANGVAAVGFAAFGPVRWAAVLPLGAGFLIGGWTGPALVRRIPARLLQILIALGGIGLAVKLGLSAYH